jgi:DNA-binding Lrp family transcriptional regulator
MSTERLDEVDRGILHLLQRDARHLTPVDIAKELTVSDGTVRNRIERLEDDGVIQGYVPRLDYEAAGYPLVVVYACSAPVARQEELAERALGKRRVVNVRELLASEGNVEVVAVGTDLEELIEVAATLTGLGLTIESQKLLRREFDRPFNHFGVDALDEE